MTGPGARIDLPDEVAVVNIGLTAFADALRAQACQVQEVDWRIPGGGDPVVVDLLKRVYGDAAVSIDAANREVVHRLDSGVPRLVDVRPLREAVPAIAASGTRSLLHCGPEIGWPDMCDPLRRSARAAVVAAGWAESTTAAQRLLDAGAVALHPAADHDVVVPMATVIGPDDPVFVVEDQESGARAFAPVNQGPGEVAWFGVDSVAAIERLRFLRDVAGPALHRVVELHGPVDVLGLAAQGVQIGDDVHLRTQGTTNLLIRSLLPELAELPDRPRRELAGFLSGNHLFFLNLAMAGAKALTLWAGQVPGSSIVTTMARNGTTFGIRLAGSSRWHLAAAPLIADALYAPGHGPESAAPDIGDSAVLELVGLGGAAAAGSPAVAAFLGGTMRDAAAATELMRQICVGESSRFTLPVLDFGGTPVGVDVRSVVESGVTPRINTGILDAHDGSGQVGAGVAAAPLDCFVSALGALAERVAVQ